MGFAVLAAAGAAAAALGALFYLQGTSVVGPRASFMYASPDWAAWGAWIAAGGLAASAAGAALWMRRR